jgi:hypothetical protein
VVIQLRRLVNTGPALDANHYNKPILEISVSGVFEARGKGWLVKRFVFFSVVTMTLMLVLAAPAFAAGDDDIPGASLAIGGSTSGTVSSSDANDVYSVYLTAGEEVHVRCDPGSASGSKGSFRLLVPGASSIASADDYIGMAYTLSGGSFFRLWADFDYVPAKSGTYYLRVIWEEGTLNYSLSVGRTSRPPLVLAADSDQIPGTPVGSGTVTGVVSTSADESDVYGVALTAGQPVTIQLKALGSSIGYLSLLDPSTPSLSSRYSHRLGDRMKADDDEVGQIQYTPAQSGTYYVLVEVGGGFFAENFPYQLIISAGEPPEPGAFVDVAGSPYATAIYQLADRGIITGFEDNTFRPNAPVSRQQFAKMIVKTMNLTVTGSEVCPFVDVGAQTGADPFYPAKYVAVCAAQGITLGKTPATFAPYDNILRQQLVSMVVRAAALSDPPVDYAPSFVPGQFYPAEHYVNARKAAYTGLLQGLLGVGPSYDFFAASTRGECAQLLYNVLQR